MQAYRKQASGRQASGAAENQPHPQRRTFCIVAQSAGGAGGSLSSSTVCCSVDTVPTCRTAGAGASSSVSVC